ncbi:hypothetical protein LQV63_15415 [Paenibacillus profundus]|uniref:Uncharacterized protein n=1 Tax=Paenibacillus profundus TaxID=1173085 RepID=A0ABS8YK25_9BACL|nr:hypothetical protein [Paenibacillus profundus]
MAAADLKLCLIELCRIQHAQRHSLANEKHQAPAPECNAFSYQLRAFPVSRRSQGEGVLLRHERWYSEALSVAGYAMTLLACLQAVRGQRKVVIEGDPEHALTKQINAAV